MPISASLPHAWITRIATQTPSHEVSQEEMKDFIMRQPHFTPSQKRKMNVLVGVSSIQKRYSVLEDFGQENGFLGADSIPSVSERMKYYEKYAFPLALQAAQKCVNDIPTHQITHLVTFSCTGMYAPGIDTQLIKALSLSPQTQRVMIQFMGCFAAFNALKVAQALCVQNPHHKVLVVGVELCSLHFTPEDTADQLLSNTLFGDGSAAFLVENTPPTSALPMLRILDFASLLLENSEEEMGWYIRDTAFQMKLSSEVAEVLGREMPTFLFSFLQKNGLSWENVHHYAIHPGGKKILETCQKLLLLQQDDLLSSYQILKQYGNMSSVTIAFVLQDILLRHTSNDAYVLGMAFGPGLTIETGLFELVSSV